MAIVVISDVGADMITIVKRKEQRMSMTLAEAYGLMYHLQFTLQALAHDQVIKDREALIQGAYRWKDSAERMKNWHTDWMKY